MRLILTSILKMNETGACHSIGFATKTKGDIDGCISRRPKYVNAKVTRLQKKIKLESSYKFKIGRAEV